MKIRFSKKILVSGIALAFALFFLILFGGFGLRFFLAVLVLYLLPIYYIVDVLPIEEDEKLVLTPFISLGVVSSIVFYVGLLVGSLKVSIGISFVLLCVAAFCLHKFFKKKINDLVHKKNEQKD